MNTDTEPKADPTKGYTPLPWHIGGAEPTHIHSERGDCVVADCRKWLAGSPTSADRANAALIVRAVNSRDPLLALIDRAVAALNDNIVPDGVSNSETISRLLGIFDGPEYREAMKLARGEA